MATVTDMDVLMSDAAGLFNEMMEHRNGDWSEDLRNRMLDSRMLQAMIWLDNKALGAEYESSFGCNGPYRSIYGKYDKPLKKHINYIINLRLAGGYIA